MSPARYNQSHRTIQQSVLVAMCKWAKVDGIGTNALDAKWDKGGMETFEQGNR